MLFASDLRMFRACSVLFWYLACAQHLPAPCAVIFGKTLCISGTGKDRYSKNRKNWWKASVPMSDRYCNLRAGTKVCLSCAFNYLCPVGFYVLLNSSTNSHICTYHFPELSPSPKISGSHRRRKDLSTGCFAEFST